MRIVYLPSCAQDFAWFHHYYTTVFPEGSEKAARQFKTLEKTLAANPFVGHPTESLPEVRELHIPRTPFALYYRVTDTQIEVLRLWDKRQGGGAI